MAIKSGQNDFHTEKCEIEPWLQLNINRKSSAACHLPRSTVSPKNHRGPKWSFLAFGSYLPSAGFYRFAASGRYGPVLWEINVRMATTKIYLRRLSRLERRNPWPHVTNRYVHKPAIVKLLLLIYSFQFRSAFRATTTPSQSRPLPSPTHYRHRHSPELICEINSSIRKRWQCVVEALHQLCTGVHYLSTRQRVVFKTSVFVWKCVHGIVPAYPRDLCNPVDPFPGRPR